MMFEFRCCYIFLLVNVLTRFVSGAENIPKLVCPGDSVQAFQNVKFDSCNAVVSLYINGNRNALIAKWTMQNCTLNSTLLPEYKGKVFLDANGTIWIHNIHPWDQAKYIVIFPMDTSPVISEVQINVMAAPAKNCRPNIMQLGSSLIASLNANNCGKPVATLYWKDSSGISNISEPVLKLTPGKESGIYYACIEGLALTCARNSTPQDYCSAFIIGGNNSPPVSLETWDVKTALCIVFGILVGISSIVAIVVIIIRKRRRRNAKQPKRDRESKQSEKYSRKRFNSWINWILARFSCHNGIQEPSCQDHRVVTIEEPENLNREQTIPLLEIPQTCKKPFGNLKWEEIMQLLNDDQQQGLQKYCDNLKTMEKSPNADQQQVSGPYCGNMKTWEKSINDDQQQVLEPYKEQIAPHLATYQDVYSTPIQLSDAQHETKEATTEHQPSTDSETWRELQELRHAALCKICFANKMNTVLLPCDHIATCVSCSNSLDNCPVCRALIMQKIIIRFD